MQHGSPITSLALIDRLARLMTDLSDARLYVRVRRVYTYI